ncbi:MAG: response regulator [Desulfobulbaceae bacterium]|nr:response regulator [Desulfobulbaceae bacterium]
MKVLLVDDEKELITTLAERLSLRGIEADWADSGEKALEMAAAVFYDLAVLDVKMPRINGLQLRNRLAKIHPKMRFIFLSGQGTEKIFKKGAAKATYLVKPINIEELVEHIMTAT